MKRCFVLFLVTLTLGSCQRNSSFDEHGHSHDEGITLSYTLYSDKTELFVEFKPLVVGLKSNFAAHFTRLGESFTSLDSGKVTVNLIVDDKGIRQSRDQASSPGIFRLALNPKTPGTGKLIFDIETPEYTDQIIIDPVTVYTDEQSAENATQPEPGGTVSFLKEQAWKIDFANQEVKRQPFHKVIKAAGQLLVKPSDETVITARSNGIVLWNDDVVVGAPVHQGQRLFVISSGNLAIGNIESQYKEAKANLEKAEADFNRVQPLLEDKIISQKDYLEIKNRYDQSRINFERISRNYSAGGLAVSSPGNGFIKQVMVQSGEFVQSGQQLLSISRDRNLMLQAEVPLRYYNDLPLIKDAHFKTLYNNSVHRVSGLNGSVLSFGKSVIDTAPLIPITFSLVNDGSLVPGEMVEVYLQSKPINDAIVVPGDALIEEQGKFYVFVQTAGETFDKRPVTLGAQDGISVQLLHGVAEGERVVTKGAYLIKLATQSGSVPAHGHEH